MFFILLLLQTIYSGPINIWDIELDYVNTGYATQFTLPFKLTNPLPTSAYLRIVFPFALHYTATSSVPDNVQVQYREAIGSYGCGLNSIIDAKIYINTIDSESNTYYIQFPQTLGSSNFYYVILKISGNSPNIQSSGVQNPVRLYSVTSISKIAMIIDYNPAAHTFALATAPFNQMLVTVELSGDSFYKMNDLYTAKVNVQFKWAMIEGCRVRLIFEESDGFQFEESCSMNAPGTCSYSNNMADFLITQQVIINDQIQFTVQIRNPSKVTLASKLQVRLFKQQIQIRSLFTYENRIMELTESDAVFQVKQLILASHKLQLGWGLEYSSRSAYFYPFPVIVFRGDYNGRSTPYNAFKWIFSLNDELPEDISLEIHIETPMKFNSYIMTGSISHNLPGSTVLCSFQSSDLSQAKIICKNVGQMYNSYSYYIGCRATFPYDQFNLPLESNFGQLNIYTVNNNVRDSLSLIQPSNPVDYIQTANNPDWTVSSHTRKFDGTIASSQPITETMQDPTLGKLGISPNLVEGEVLKQRLIFNLAISIKDITSISSTPAVGTQTVPYSAGIIIIANNNLVITDSTDTLPETTIPDATQYFLYDYKSSSLASYLQLTIGASKISGLLNMFAYNTDQSIGEYNQFAVKDIQIKFHSSQYADEYLLDFYIGTFDQLQSAYPIFRDSILTNAYTITSPNPSNIRFGISNYFTSTLSGNEGDYFPTILRIAGYFAQTDLENASSKLSIFFTNMIPFYTSSDSTNDNSVACKFTGLTALKCNYFSAGLLGNGQSYMNFERVDIEFENIPTNPDDAFQLLIPMKNLEKRGTVTAFIGAVVQNPLYSSTAIQLRTIFRMTGGNNINTNQFAFTTETILLGSGYIKSGILNPAYSLDPQSLTVGSNSTSLTFKIGHSDTFNVVLGNSNLNDYSNGGAFTLTSSAQFYTSDTSYVTSISISNSKSSSCTQFSYIQQFINSLPSYKYVIYCPFDKGSESSATLLTLNSANLPFINGEKLPTRTVYTWSDATRGLVSFKVDTTSLIPNPGVIKIVGVTPSLAIGLSQQQLQWQFTTQNPIPSGATIRVEFNGAINFTPINSGQRCSLGIFSHQCTITFTASPTAPQINFKISDCSSCPLAAGTFTLLEWGVDNGASAGTKVSFHIRILSEQLNTIDISKVMSSLDYNNVAALPSSFLGNTDFQFYNRRARGILKLDFSASRSIWKQEYVLIDIGGFMNDNQRNKDNLFCQILNSNGTVSTQWKQLDYTLDKSASVSGIKIYPLNDINDVQTFTLKCNGIIFPFSFNPSPMSLMLLVQGTFTEIETSNSVALDVLLPDAETSFPMKNIKLVRKSNNVGGSQTDITIQFISTLMDIKLGSTIFVVFPTTYPLYVSLNQTYCSLNTNFVACSIIQENTIILENFDISITKLSTATLRIFGAQQSELFNSQSNEIFIGLTTNTNTSYLVEYGVAYDLQPQDMILNPPSSMRIQLFSITNNFIRSNSSITFKIVIPYGSINLNNIFQIDFPPSWDMIINYKLPTCSLYSSDNKTNYASKCTNFGNRVVISISQTDFIGNSYYYLTLSNLRNPDYSNCEINKWTLTILKLDGSVVYVRSHAPDFNTPTINYISNPSQITLKYIDPLTNQDISTLQIKMGVLVSNVGLAAESGAFVRSFQIYSVNSQFIQNPIYASASMGQASTQFNIAGSNKAPQGLQLIELGKTDDYDRHTALPFLRVFLSQQVYQLKTESKLYTLPVGGQALPLLFNFTDKLPAGNLRIEGTISNEKIYFKSKSSLTFGPSASSIGALVIAAEDNGINVGDSAILTLSISGLYSTQFSTLDSVSIRIVNPTKKRPLITLISIDRGADYLVFGGSCTQYATIYYLLAINGSQILHQEEIYNNILNFPTSSILDKFNENYGLRNAFTLNELNEITVSSLRPSTTYNITAFCYNTESKYSVPASIVQTTKSNGGKSFYLDFSFESEIDIDFSKSITCFLTTYFKIPSRLVRNSVNSWCEDSISPSSYTYSEKNVRIYVSSFDFQPVDKVTSGLLGSTLNKSALILQLYEQVAGLPNLNKLSDLTLIQTSPPNFINISLISLNYTQNAVTISNITLDAEGFLYIMIDYSNRTRYPCFYDIRIGNSTLQNQTTDQTYFVRQRLSKATSTNYTFEGLSHYTNYTIYFYVSNDDPTVFQQRTYVRQKNFTTEPKYQMCSIMIKLLIIVWLIMI